MKNRWAVFVIGIILGLVIGLSVSYMLGQRYAVTSAGPSGIMMIKIDKLTGRSWMARYYEKNGTKIWHWTPLEENH